LAQLRRCNGPSKSSGKFSVKESIVNRSKNVPNTSFSWVTLLAFWAAAGCAGGGSGTGSTAVARDSAGVTIVENSGEAWSAESAWRLDEVPTVDIGGSEEDPLYDLGLVGGAARLSDRRIVIANGATQEVRFYDVDGTHLMSKGRNGSGPGEYQSLAGLFRPVGDSSLVYDAINRRLTLLDPDGEVVRSFYLGGETGLQMPSEGRVALALPTGRFGDGSILGMVLAIQLDSERTGAFRDSVEFLLYDANGAARDTISRLPGIEMEMMTLNLGNQTFPQPTGVPLGKNTVTTAGGQWFYACSNDSYEIDVRNTEGTLVRRIRVGGAPVSITDADKTAHRKEQLEALADLPQMAAVPEPLKEQFRARIDKATYPQTFPFVESMQVDEAGNLWVQEVQRPGTTTHQYAVFDSTGVLLGRVKMPMDFRPTFIGLEEIVGIWEDEDDLQHVQAHALIKP
jgi:hypothetical protein